MQTAALPPAGAVILVVEDEYLLASDVSADLTAHGARVLGPAASVEAALDLAAAAERIDAAVLDINLRGATAFPLADRLTAQGIPILFVTGYSHDGMPERYRTAPRCEKPVSAADLRDAVCALLSAHRADF